MDFSRDDAFNFVPRFDLFKEFPETLDYVVLILDFRRFRSVFHPDHLLLVKIIA